MKFVDEAKVRVCGGNGGSGFVSWRREKFIPLGGPDGGDGGNGGAVIFLVDPGLNTLIDFSFKHELKAEDGSVGEANCRTGRNGDNIVVPVPLGTQVFYNDNLVADLNQPYARWAAARGGRGGKGNHFFKSATNQAPDRAQPGRAGEIREFKLVLKSVADVGLAGLPNVGKSTVVSAVTRAHPKIADYPFTTLAPSLGVVLLGEKQRFVMADIPGLVPGAHEGKGLGLTFLQHIERTKVLAQLIDVSSSLSAKEHLEPSTEQLRKAALEQFELIDRELKLFSEEVAGKPRLIVFSKADLDICRRSYDATRKDFAELGFDTCLISSATGEGLSEFKQNLFKLITSGSSPRQEETY